jgi:hypothetical protein
MKHLCTKKKNIMWKTILVILCIFMIAVMIYKYNSIIDKFNTEIDQEQRMIRTACDQSINSANTANPLEALLSIHRALLIIEMIIERHGSGNVDNMFRLPIVKLEREFREQEKRTLSKILQTYPGMKPVGINAFPNVYSEVK